MSIAVSTELARAVPVGDVVAVRDRLAAERGDLVDDGLGRRPIAAGAVRGHAEVVDHDDRAFASERERVLAADAAPRAGHDHDASFADARHECVPYRPCDSASRCS